MTTWRNYGTLNRSIGGGLLLLGFMVLMLNASHLFSQTAAPISPPPSTGLQVVSSASVSGVQQLVVLDQGSRSLAVYHVDATGNLQLRSVRTLLWDLRMEEFNAQAPTPSELRRVQP